MCEFHASIDEEKDPVTSC